MPARIIGVQRSERNRTLLTAVHQSVPMTRDDMHVHSRLLSGARVTSCSSVAVVLLRSMRVQSRARQCSKPAWVCGAPGSKAAAAVTPMLAVSHGCGKNKGSRLPHSLLRHCVS